MAVVAIKSRRDSPTQEDIWACAEHINRNKYHERMKPQERQSPNADFIDPAIKCVYGVKCIRADCDLIAFNTSSLAESALKQSDTEMFLCRFIQKAVTHVRASSLVFVTFHRPFQPIQTRESRGMFFFSFAVQFIILQPLSYEMILWCLQGGPTTWKHLQWFHLGTTNRHFSDSPTYSTPDATRTVWEVMLNSSHREWSSDATQSIDFGRWANNWMIINKYFIEILYSSELFNSRQCC